ncbi:recombinase family protein [Pseudobdellovibrio sp. HCB154]|uniref:recombinase family protein n=1 Tax=Pseudobdellovibrio sp. HCB154 TaxID=3386277 RepID=UPI003916F40C
MIYGKIVPHKTELKVIQKILKLHSSGATYSAVADWLNDRNVPTKNGAEGWQRPTVFKIIKKNDFRKIQNCKSVNTIQKERGIL